MPIKGVSEVRRLPRLGKVRLGYKDGSRGFPKAVDYFLVHPDQSTSEAASAAFHEMYGDKPRSIDIIFPTERVEEFFPQWYRRYGSGSGLLCKGDGELATELNRETGELREIECTPERCQWFQKKQCRQVGTLLFLLPYVAGLGAWQIDTSSFNSIVNVNSGIDFIKKLTGGRIAMIPLKLVLRPKDVQVDGKKKTVHVLDLAHEQVRLADVLSALKKSPEQLFLPPIPDLNERPDDLYVDEAEEPAASQATESGAAAATEGPAAADQADPPSTNSGPVDRDEERVKHEARQLLGHLLMDDAPAGLAMAAEKCSDFIREITGKEKAKDCTLDELNRAIAQAREELRLLNQAAASAGE